MGKVSGASRYSRLLIALHWIVALCVVGQIPGGFLVSRLDDGPMQETVSSVHQSFGVLILLLMLVRLALRARGRMPEPPDVLTPFERAASRVNHFCLYTLLVLTPIIGWLGVNAYGEDVSFFGLFKLPMLLGKDESFSEEIFAMHLACAMLIVLAIIAHVVAAFVHKVRDDGVMERMLPDP